MSLQHSSPSPTSEERQNRFAAPSLNQPTTNQTAGEAGNHFSARAASQPPRSSSTASNTVLPSPNTAPRSPWSQSQSSSVKHPRDRYLSPTRTSGIPMPSQTRSSSFSGAGLGAQPHSFSGLGSSGGAGPGYFTRFDSTFEDDESLLDNPQYGVEDDGVDEDDVDAMIGRIRPSADPYDEYSDSPVYSRRGVGIAGGGGAGRYNIGGGRLPPSLSSSLSPSQLPGKHQSKLYVYHSLIFFIAGTVPLMSPSPRSSTSSSLASQIMKDDVRGRTYASDLSRSRSQSLATTTVGRLSAGFGAAGMYGCKCSMSFISLNTLLAT
ncbi:MAG: hypothetical protein NXY57DRAFT_413168 [Lentinula lateritia]|uniref:Uncharacterized protein n=1 Tax=Lentinula lateritia TaxID=40482 RepID=A0ABQ8V480_9AGAR|nr:MAG: hypothetical protein NXY57DRAFT_413168 [Lentinula lateritia]KAJ4468512.1 hypothetical protein C8R41DRAFT_40261 [Lentinula lateritia]